MKASFIRIAELWLPDQEHTHLAFGGGILGPAEPYESSTRSLTFAKGEGLPGQAWAQGRPVLLKEVDRPPFHRAAMARELGLACAIALPLFVGAELRAVVLLLGGSEEVRAGAIELWHNNPRVTTDMTLVDGFYGTASDSFEVLSKDTSLPRGTGLPGLAWQRGGAVFMDDLGSAPRFLRGATAAEAGITRGLALPCPTRTDEVFVLTLLSALGTPIVQKVESWAPDATRLSLQRGFGFCEAQGRLAEPSTVIALDTGTPDALARSFLSGVPTVESNSLHLPVIAEGEVTEVLSLSL